jgi:hypothetical protein
MFPKIDICCDGDCQVTGGENLDLQDTASISRFLKYGNYNQNDHILSVIEMLDDAANIQPTLDQVRRVWGALTMALNDDPTPCSVYLDAEINMMWACLPRKQIMP